MLLRVLGTVDVLTRDGRVLTLRRRQERCLLGVLVLQAEQAIPAERLCALLWEGEPPERARAALRTYVTRIRGVLAEAGAAEHGVVLTAGPHGYKLSAPPDCLDAQRFRDLVQAAAEAVDPNIRDDRYRQALALWRGPVLASAATDDVRRRLAADLEELRLHAIEEAMATGLELGHDTEILPELARLASEPPLRERLVELHMVALYRAGRTTEALEAFERARGRLADRLGLDPGPALRRSHQAILRGEDLGVAAHAHADAVTPAQLPAASPGFVGREAYLRQLDTLLTRPTAAIAIVSGTAGVGKTALALHWGHTRHPSFPDGQLFLNLRGFDADAMTPAAAMRQLLDALGVPAERIPAGLPAQTGLYRSLLAGKRALVLLDNARDAEQVRPLLPGAPGCVTVVTSRAHLTGLAAIEGATLTDLDLLSASEARTLLSGRIGGDRVAADTEAADRIGELCARLPLALAIAAAHAAASPGVPLATLADDLSDAGRRLDKLRGDDTLTDIRAVFSGSYATLPAPAARLFRLLCLHRGATVSAAAAASLLGCPIDEIGSALDDLVQAHLLSNPAAGRYAMHDLLRVYATELLAGEQERKPAADRLFDHLLHTAYEASRLLQPHRDPIALAPPAAGVVVERLAAYADARTWLTVEQPALVTAVRELGDTGSHARAWQLAWTLENHLDWWGNFDELATTQNIALDAARQLGDRSGQARIHRGTARALTRAGRFDDAYAHLLAALELHTGLGDVLGEIDTQHNLTHLFEKWGRPTEALGHARQAHALAVKAADRSRSARALNAIGWQYALLTNFEQAADSCRQALVIYQELGNRKGEAATWHSIGYAHRHLGAHALAADCLQHAIDLDHEIGDRHHEAAMLMELGETRELLGEADAAHDARRRAAAIYADLR